jgi:hypothetical protein
MMDQVINSEWLEAQHLALGGVKAIAQASMSLPMGGCLFRFPPDSKLLKW